MKVLIFLIALVSVSISFAQHKDVGGGNGVGGTLLDVAAYADVTPRSGAQLYQILQTYDGFVFDKFPLLAKLSREVLETNKSWYLDERQFAPACRNQVIPAFNQQVVACQNDIEVRINKDWWFKSTFKQKADLLLHEVITSLWLKKASVKSIQAVVASLLNPAESTEQTQLKMSIAGLPVFDTGEQLETKIREMGMGSVMAEHCAKHPTARLCDPNRNPLIAVSPTTAEIYKNSLWEIFKNTHPDFFE